MSYSTQNLGSLMDDLGADGSAGGAKKSRGGSAGVPFWKSQGFAIVLAVIALVILAGGFYVTFFNTGSPKPPDTMTLIDYKSGELFSTKLGSRSYVIPMKNPDTGERTLLPVSQDEYGDWVVSSRYRGLLPEQEANQNVVRNASRGTVSPIDESVTKLNLN